MREECPECFVSTSAEVAPQFREFERFTTALLNAFVGPKVRDYVAGSNAQLGASGFAADLHVMARTAASRPRRWWPSARC